MQLNQERLQSEAELTFITKTYNKQTAQKESEIQALQEYTKQRHAQNEELVVTLGGLLELLGLFMGVIVAIEVLKVTRLDLFIIITLLTPNYHHQHQHSHAQEKRLDCARARKKT